MRREALRTFELGLGQISCIQCTPEVLTDALLKLFLMLLQLRKKSAQERIKETKIPTEVDPKRLTNKRYSEIQRSTEKAKHHYLNTVYNKYIIPNYIALILPTHFQFNLGKWNDLLGDSPENRYDRCISSH